MLATLTVLRWTSDIKFDFSQITFHTVHVSPVFITDICIPYVDVKTRACLRLPYEVDSSFATKNLHQASLIHSTTSEGRRKTRPVTPHFKSLLVRNSDLLCQIQVAQRRSCIDKDWVFDRTISRCPL